MYPQKLQTAYVLRTSGDEQTEHKVKIVDITEDYIYIDPPRDHNGYMMFIPVGDEVRLAYSTDRALYVAQTNVVTYQRDRVALLVLTRPDKDNIHKQQRRKHFRVPVSIPATLHAENVTIQVTMADLSAGGFSFYHPGHMFPMSSTVYTEFALPTKGGAALRYEGTIRRAVPQDVTDSTRYGVEFLNLEEKRQEAILRYCMERQMDLKRKGLMG